MSVFRWAEDKNNELLKKRGIGFEEIVSRIETGNVVEIKEHPNKLKYPTQSIYVVKTDKYIYLVPFVKNGKEIFLKTIFPTRKAKREYAEGEK